MPLAVPRAFAFLGKDVKAQMNIASKAWSSISKFGREQWQELSKTMARRKLESDLATIIRTVSGHKRNKVPAGAPQYRSLWHIANQKAGLFCEDYQVDRGELEAQVPALKELEELAQKPDKSKQGAKVAGGLVTGVVVFTLSGFAAGIIQWLFHLGMNFAHYLTGSL
jgi:hypothetical protein